MKFMKLGNRPDTFFTSGSVTSVSSEIASDLTIRVENAEFRLHKFPLLCKCAHLKRILLDSPETSPALELEGFPGGATAFELCAKFCYGITVTLSAANVVAVRCAAEYLRMSDDLEKGNLAGKLDSFLCSCLLRRWKDSLTVVQTTGKWPSWSEEIGITGKCVDAVAQVIVTNPSRRSSGGWWAEEISELGADHFWRIMVCLKSAGGRVSDELIGEAVMVYAGKDKLSSSEMEKIVSIIPQLEKGSVPFTFLLRLLKMANLRKSMEGTRVELARMAGVRLEEASPTDLLVPTPEKSDTIHDSDVVILMLEEYLKQGNANDSTHRRKLSRPEEEEEEAEFECGRRSSSVSHGSKAKLAKTIDGYLKEIAGDVNLPMEKLLVLAKAMPEFLRTDHDDLYRAIDIYLKAHPDLSKSDRKRLCRVLDCKKLSVETCIHAAQNEMLPLRVVVQVLFFEQARSSLMSGCEMTSFPSKIKAILEGEVTRHESSNEWSISPAKSNVGTLRMRLEEDQDSDEDENEDDNDHDLLKANGLGRSSSLKLRALSAIPNKPKKMISKLLSLSRSISLRH